MLTLLWEIRSLAVAGGDVLLVLLAVDAGGDVGDQVREKIAKSLPHFSAKSFSHFHNGHQFYNNNLEKRPCMRGLTLSL